MDERRSAVSRFPNPVGDVLVKAGSTLANADEVLGDVKRHLRDVDATLSHVGGTVSDSTEVLGDVKELLAELREHLGVLARIPALEEQIREMHRMVSALADGAATRA
jgi:ABC-type transporter Mla subunit MlaD